MADDVPPHDCVEDAVPLEPAGTVEHPFWECPVCGRRSVSVP